MGLALLMFIGGIVICGLALYAILMNEKKKNPKNKKGGAPKKKGARNVAKSYRFLSENFLTRNAFMRVVESLSNLAVYNFLEIQRLAVKYYTRTVGICVGAVVLTALLMRDLTAVILMTLFAFVAYNVLIKKRIDEAHVGVVKELSITLASIREAYTQTRSIPDAINACKKGKYLQAPLDRIYLILTATNAEALLDEFYRAVPFHMLQTLASICYILNDKGDEETENGISVFKNAITLLKSDADAEIRKLTQQKVMFQFLEYMPLIPIPFIKILQWFFITYIPGTATIYNGLIGYISQTLVILSALVAYVYITSINSPVAVRMDDRNPMMEKIAANRQIRNIVSDVMPKSLRDISKVKKLLNGALSTKDMRYLYTSKLLSAVAAACATLVLLTMFSAFSKDYIKQNLLSASLMGGTVFTVEEEATMRSIDEYVLSQEVCPREEELRSMIEGAFPKMTTIDVEDQVDRLEKKHKDYYNAHFHWYFILIAYLVGYGAWQAPNLILAMRKKSIAAEAQEDVLQLQTLIAILMYTNLDTHDVLYWLGQQSRVHKEALNFAYHEYPSDPEKALTRLRDKSSVPEFQQMMDSLMSTVYQVSLLDAFGDLAAERSHITSLRETVQNQALKNKRALASPFAKAPLMITAAGYVLVPIAILGYNEVMKMVVQLGGI